MPTFVFTGGDGRDYFPAHIGHVEPGDERDLDEAPDTSWTLKVSPKPSPVKTPDPAAD